MAVFPCPIVLPECGCDQNPVRNLSAAAPDLPEFTGVAYVSLVPPLGVSAPGLPCVSFCDSLVSQADANACAQAAAIACVIAPWRGPDGGPQSPPVPPPVSTRGTVPFSTSGNDPQTGVAKCPDGSTFSYTTPRGMFVGYGPSALAQANAKALSYANQQAAERMVCLGSIQALACSGTAYSSTLTATGNFVSKTPPDTDFWEIIFGGVPAGMTFHGGHVTGGSVVIDGTPATTGQFVFLVRVTDTNGGQQTKSFSITVAGVTSSLPPGSVGTPYSQQIQTAGFTTPVFSLASGSFPDGLSMDSGGLVTGTPTTAGSSSAVVDIFEEGSDFNCQGTVDMTVSGSPDVLCCNCGLGAKIVGFNPALFTFDHSGFENGTATTFSHIVPSDGCVETTGFCSDKIQGMDLGPQGFVKMGGNWFAVTNAGSSAVGCAVNAFKPRVFRISFGDGFAAPNMFPCDGSTLIGCYNAADAIEGTFSTFKQIYDLAYGNGAWDGKFTLTDTFGNGSCATQWFACNHLNGWGYFGIELDQTPNGPNFDWIFTIFANPAVNFNTPFTPGFTTMWQGQLINAPTQNGVYVQVGGAMTGPATLTIGPN